MTQPGSVAGAAPLPTPSVGRLGRELHAACMAATQPEEIAAALEAHGLNDDLARQQYGLPNVFACAEALFTHLPYRAPLQTTRPPTRPVWEVAPKGLLYALPGAALALAGPLVSPYPGAQTALFLAVVFGWGWGQGLASIGYRKTGAPQLHFLRWATLFTLPVAALVGLLGALVAGQPLLTGGVVGALAGTSFAAFAALLILGRVTLAALAYLPSLAALMVAFLRPDLSLSGQGATGLWVAVGCAALLPMLALLGGRPPVAGLQLPLPAWHLVLAHAASGWTCALFVTTAFNAPTWRLLGPGAIVPVIVSVGAMEVLSLRFYGRLYPMARRYSDLPRLAWSALRLLGGTLGLYLLALAALLGLYLGVTGLLAPAALAGFGADRAVTAQIVSALMLYGAALLVGTVVSNVGQPWITSAAWLLGTLIFVLAPLAHLPALPILNVSLLGVLAVMVVMAAGVLKMLLLPATYR